MPLLDQIRAGKLIELARNRYSPSLTDAELLVLRDSAGSTDVDESEPSSPGSSIPTEFFRWLAADSEAALQIDPKGIRVAGIEIPGDLDLEGCQVSVLLTFQWCVFQGIVKLESADTQGIFLLNCTLNKGVSASRIKIRGPLFLDGCRIFGEVNLVGAGIEGQLSCTDAELCVSRDTERTEDWDKAHDAHSISTGEDDEMDALSADSAEIGGDVYCDEGFKSDGSIRLFGAHVKGDVYFFGAQLMVRRGRALIADRAEIEGAFYLSNDFVASGAVCLIGTLIKGDLNFTRAAVTEVRCRNLRLSCDLLWRRIRNPERSSLDLTGAKLKKLQDDEASWPANGKLVLDGLVYDELSHAETRGPAKAPLHDAQMRIRWLMRQLHRRGIRPQPWMQLAAYLEARGDHRGAKHVHFKLRCVQALGKGPLMRRWVVAFAWLEEAPGRIWRSIAFLLILGCLIFGNAWGVHALAPTETEAYKDFRAGTPMPNTYPKLNPIVYTLENAVPLAKLGQDDKWAPDPKYSGSNWLTNYWFLMWARWLLILSGWFQAAVLGAALLARFKS